MSTNRTSPRNGLGLCLAFAAGVAVTTVGLAHMDRVAFARPQDSNTSKQSSAAKRLEEGGLNPAEHRVEMIRLLQSIDRRLETIAANTNQKPTK